MRDDFYENTAAPQNEKMQKVLYSIYNVVFAVFIIALCVFLYLLLMLGDSGFITLFVLSVVCAVGVFFVRRRLLTYYDYTFIGGEVRIVKVINGKTRRLFCVINCRDVFQIGREGSPSFENLCAAPNVKKRYATANGKNVEGLYYVALSSNGEKSVIIMECDEKMLSYIAAYCGRSVIEKDYGRDSK